MLHPKDRTDPIDEFLSNFYHGASFLDTDSIRIGVSTSYTKFRTSSPVEIPAQTLARLPENKATSNVSI